MSVTTTSHQWTLELVWWRGYFVRVKGFALACRLFIPRPWSIEQLSFQAHEVASGRYSRI
jgi:hypothetical protein